MLLIEYVGHTGLRSLSDGHLGRHLEYFKTLNDARKASVGFIKYKASTTRISKEKNVKIKSQVILVFHWTNVLLHALYFRNIYCLKLNSMTGFGLQHLHCHPFDALMDISFWFDTVNLRRSISI